MLKYKLIEQDIKHQIETFVLKPNQVILSEAALCDQYNVSRITVRKAIDELVMDDFLYRIKGKGCFVREKAATKLSHIYSFTEAVRNQGKVPSKRQLSFSEKKADSELASKLGIETADMVYEIRSVYMADATPFSVCMSLLPVKMFPKLDFFNFNNKSLYEVLESFYNLHIFRVNQKIDAVIGTDEINTLLKIEKGHPLLRLKAVSYAMIKGKEQAFEVYETYTLTDVQSYYVEKYNR